MSLRILNLFLIIKSILTQSIVILSVSNIVTQDNTQAFSSIKGISILKKGNAYIYIKGVGFSDLITENQVNLMNIGTQENIPCEITSSTSQIISCLTTQAQSGTYNVQITQNDGTYSQCNQQCQVIYDQQYTPQLNFIVPRSQIPGQYVAFNIIPIVQTSDEINYFKTGDYFCDRYDFVYNLPFQDPTISVSFPHCRTISNVEAGLYDTISLNTIYGDSQIITDSRIGYDIANDQTYQYRVVPSIYQIDYNQGSSQGQILTISGVGFSNDASKIFVTADGINCLVLQNSINQIQCEVQPGQSSGLQTYNGNNGLKLMLFDTVLNAKSIFKYAQNPVGNSLISIRGNGILLETEFIGYEQDWQSDSSYIYPLKYYGLYANGYFVPPATGNYTFYCSSDDKMVVYLSTVPDSVDINDQQLIIDHDQATDFRDYWSGNVGFSQSDVIQLEQGQKYYIQIAYNQYEGNDQFSLAVRTPLQQNTVNTITEQRILEINTYQQYELFQITLNNITNGTFSLNYNANISDDIDLFCVDLSTYLTQVGLISTDVSMTLYDYDDQPTTNQTEAFKVVWICQVTDYRENIDYPLINLQNLSGQPDGNIANINVPTLPPNGTFIISQTLQDGTVNNSSDIDIFVSADDLKNIFISRQYNIIKSFGLSDSMQITQIQSAQDTGVSQFQITYSGLFGSLGNQFTYDASNIVNNYDQPAIVTDSILIEGSLDQVFEPIPMEMLTFAETQPSINVVVNNIQSVCPNQNCYYIIDDTKVPTISSFTWTDPTLQIDFSDYVDEQALIIGFNDIPCTITTFSNTSLSCDLPLNDQNQADIQVSGLYLPKVLLDPVGYALLDPTLTPVEIPLICNSISPISISPNGGAQITVSVTGIDQNIQIFIGSFQIQNYTIDQNGNIQFFAPNVTLIQDSNFTINIQSNSVQVNCDDSLSYDNTDAFQITQISPNDALPYQSGQIVIDGVNFGTDQSNILVQLIGQNQNYDLQVTDVQDTQIQADFTQGVIDTYYVQVTKLNFGVNDLPDDITITQFTYSLSQFSIQSISANKGSIFGGQTLIITGQNFIPDQTRNQIQINCNQYNALCQITDINETTITCITQQITEVDTFIQNPSVISLIQDGIYQANCDSCDFQFIYPAYIQSLSQNNITQAGVLVSLIGNGFQQTDLVTFYLNGTNEIQTPNKQIYVNKSRINLNFDYQYQGLYNIVVLSNLGYLNQNISFNVNIGVKQSVMTTQSLLGGEFIYKAYGLPTQFNIYYNCISTNCTQNNQPIQAQLISSNQTTIDFIVYNLQQYTYQVVLNTTNQQIVLGKFSTKSQAVVNNINQQIKNSNLILNVTGTNLQFVTKTFLLSSNSDQEFNNVQIPGVISNNKNTQLTITFNNLMANTYNLYLQLRGTTFVDFKNPSQQQITFDFQVNPITPINNSYTGGQLLSISGQGFGQNEIYVCIYAQEYLCQIQDQSASNIDCLVPQLITQQTNQDFNLVQTQQLSYFVDYDITFYNDNNLFTYGQSNDVYFDIFFDQQQQTTAQIDYIRFFISSFQNLTNFIGNSIQGYNGTDYQNIMTFNQSFLNLGWNQVQINGIFSQIRFLDPQQTSQLEYSEIQIYGIKYINFTNCPVIIIAKQFNYNYTQDNAVNYLSELTGIITSIEPNRGLNSGGDQITINGTFLEGDIKVLFDDIECVVVEQSLEQVICTTGQKVNFTDSSGVQIINNGQIIANNEQTFLYYSLWSDVNTWQVVPIDGSDITISSGQNIILDQTTVILNNVIIEGSLIIQDTDLELHAHNIIVQNGGHLQIGSSDQPLQNNVQIIIHGTVDDNQFPLFGNKVLAVIDSQLDIFGAQRDVSWTYLSQSINVGDTQFTVENNDWNQGDQIVVSSSSYDMNEAEVKTIISNDNGLITVDSPFQYFHYSQFEQYDDFQFQMQAEVALLSRNIIFKGSDDDSSNYGAHIFILGQSQINIQNLQMTQVGQSNIVNRYPINFNQGGQGTVQQVVCYGSYSGFIKLQNVNNIQIINNVAYDTYGHQYKLQDGSEIQNTLDSNLGINAKQTWTLTYSDVSVANYYIANPDNNIINCNAAGSEFYGFAYQLKANSQQATANQYICPNQTPLSLFSNNTAHTVQKIGLFINQHDSVTYPCNQINLMFDDQNNPIIQSQYDSIYLWKCREKGIQAGQIGGVTFSNLMIADFGVSGIDIQESQIGNSVFIQNSLIVGQSNNDQSDSQSNIGIMMPRTDGLTVQGLSFYNFASDTSSAVQTCSTCQNLCNIRQDGATYNLSQITFNNVTVKAIWNGAFQRDIILDQDGSFTETQFQSWLLAYQPHLNGYNCQILDDTQTYGIQVILCADCFIRKISIYGIVNEELTNLPMKIVNIQSDLTDDQVYTVQFKGESQGYLSDSWSFNVLSGQTYIISIKSDWGQIASDWSQIQIEPFYQRQSDEPNTIIQYQFQDSFELLEAQQNQLDVLQRKIYNVGSDFSIDQQYNLGDFYYDNVTKLIQIAINGQSYGTLNYQTIYCKFYCQDNIDPNTGRENFQRYWGDPDGWSEIGYPQDGQDLVLPFEWNIIMDIQPNIFGNLILDGLLYFGTDLDQYTIQANNIYIRQGGLFAGDNQTSYEKQIIIQLTGSQDNNILEVIQFKQQDQSNVLFNNNTLQLYGITPSTISTVLTQSAKIGDNMIFVDQIDGWTIGDTLIISASEWDNQQSEQVTISDISGNQITLNENLQFNHYGSSQQIIYNEQTVDIRTIVAHMSRNIKINTNSDWNCRVYSQGYTELHGVEIQNCGQSGVGALDLIDADSLQVIQGSTIYDTNSIGVRVQNVTQDVQFNDNVIYNVQNSAFYVSQTQSLTFQNNIMIQTIANNQDGVLISAFNSQDNQSDQQIISNNIAVDSMGVGFTYSGYDCTDQEVQNSYINRMSGNKAFSSQIGLACLLGGNSNQCLGCNNFMAYKCNHGFDTFENVYNVIAENMTLLENQIGTNIFVVGQPENLVNINNFVFDALPRQDCDYCYQDQCSDMVGLIFPLAVSGQGGQLPPLQGQNMIDYITVKNKSSEGLDTYTNNIQFINYQINYENQANCTNNKMIQLYPTPDIDSEITFQNSNLQNSSIDSLIYFQDPDQSLIKNGCGNMECTGLINILITDNDGGILGTKGQAIPNNQNQGVIMEDCQFIENWNGYLCSNLSYGVLRFQSLSWDSQNDINATAQLLGNNFDNDLNMNYGWEQNQDGSSKNNSRKQQFQSLFQYNNQYDVIFKSKNQPSKIQFQISQDLIDQNYNYIILNYQFNYPCSFNISLENGTQIQNNFLNNDVDLNQYGNLCGYNIIDAQDNSISFILTNDPNCIVILSMLSIVQVSMKFNTSLTTFKQKNGQKNLVNQISKFLNISLNQIQVTSLMSGSTIIQYVITPTQDEQDTKNVTQIVTDIHSKLTTAVKGGQLDLTSYGPLLSFASAPHIVISSNQTQSGDGSGGGSGGGESGGGGSGGGGSGGGESGGGGSGGSGSGNTTTPQQPTPQQLNSTTFEWWKILLIVLGVLASFGIAFKVYKHYKNKKLQIMTDGQQLTQKSQKNNQIINADSDEKSKINQKEKKEKKTVQIASEENRPDSKNEQTRPTTSKQNKLSDKLSPQSQKTFKRPQNVSNQNQQQEGEQVTGFDILKPTLPNKKKNVFQKKAEIQNQDGFQ